MPAQEKTKAKQNQESWMRRDEKQSYRKIFWSENTKWLSWVSLINVCWILCFSHFFSFFSLLSLSIFYRFDKYSKRAQLGQDADQLMTEKSNVQINHWLCCACAYSLSTYSINGLMASRLYDAVYCIVNWVCARNSVRKFIWLFKHAPYKYQLTLSLLIWMYVLYVFLYAPCISYVLMTHTCILKWIWFVCFIHCRNSIAMDEEKLALIQLIRNHI